MQEKKRVKGAVRVGLVYVPAGKDRDIVAAIQRIVRDAAEHGIAA